MDNLNLTLPPELGRFSHESAVPRSELAYYKAIVQENQQGTAASNRGNQNILQFFKREASTMPILSQLALTALCTPASSADVERSFSLLNRVLCPARSSMTEINLGAHLRLSFNSQLSLSLEENVIEADSEAED